MHATAATSNNIFFFQQIMLNVQAHIYLEQLENTRPLLYSWSGISFEERGISIHMQISGRMFWSLAIYFSLCH